MNNGYDVIVLGLGGMGSATAYQLAKRGRRVLGIEQFTPAHDRGSSHGRSRIIRQAYYESPVYVPLLRRAYELWRELEIETDRRLMLTTGGLMIGAADSAVVRGSLGSAREHGLAHELLNSAQIRRRFPAFRVTDEVALYEASSGALFPEACVAACLDRAAEQGAELVFETPVTDWRAMSAGVEVEAHGVTYRADRLVITAGAWAGKLLADLGLPLVPERNVLFWFDPAANRASFAPGAFPVFIWDQPGYAFYGMPDLDGSGVKAGFHHSGIRVDPDNLDRTVHESETAAIRERLAQCIPDANGPLRSSVVCMYTNTPDENFVIDRHPLYPQVSMAAGFSGHGFKFACVVGEILAGLAMEGRTAYTIDPFRANRLLLPTTH